MTKKFKLGCQHRRHTSKIDPTGMIIHTDHCTNMKFKNHFLETKYCDYSNCEDLK